MVLNESVEFDEMMKDAGEMEMVSSIM